MDDLPLVVTVPINFDGPKAEDVGDQLRTALSSRSVVIADLTQTCVCDLAAICELCMAHELALTRGAELRIAIRSGAILHQFAVAGLDTELHIFASVRLAGGTS
ncbi:MAG: STAS domain-containing protein [Streptosporangiaceae bacterium]